MNLNRILKAALLGVYSCLICELCGFEITQWQYWIISLSIIIIPNIYKK